MEGEIAMTGREIIDWIKENSAEEDEIYIEVSKGLFKDSNEFEVLCGEDCAYDWMVILR